MKKYCICCGKEIPQKFHSIKYCSKACRSTYNSRLHRKRSCPQSSIRVCKYCGKRFYYIHGQDNYGNIGCKIKPYEYCSYECGVKHRSQKYKQSYDEEKKIKAINKIKETKYKNHGNENYNNTNKRKNTCLKKYGVQFISQLKEIQQKISETKNKRYGSSTYNNAKKAKITYFTKSGYDNPSKNPEIKKKKRDTFHKNNTSRNSKEEIKAYCLLKEKFSDVKSQYTSEEYPFMCDFYIPHLNLYIEYQGTWMHGKLNKNKIYGPYNKDNPIHKEVLTNWKINANKNMSQYKAAIKVWTITDPLKRKIAKKNKLNWIEFFTIEELKTWLLNFS